MSLEKNLDKDLLEKDRDKAIELGMRDKAIELGMKKYIRDRRHYLKRTTNFINGIKAKIREMIKEYRDREEREPCHWVGIIGHYGLARDEWHSYMHFPSFLYGENASFIKDLILQQHEIVLTQFRKFDRIFNLLKEYEEKMEPYARAYFDGLEKLRK